MPLNKERKNSKFEVVVEQHGLWDLTKKTLVHDTITVPHGYLEMDITHVGPQADQTSLIISSNGDDDPGYSAELDYVPIGGGPISNLIFEAKLALDSKNGMKSRSNINFASPDITTELEAPLIAGRITAKIRRLT